MRTSPARGGAACTTSLEGAAEDKRQSCLEAERPGQVHVHKLQQVVIMIRSRPPLQQRSLLRMNTCRGRVFHQRYDESI